MRLRHALSRRARFAMRREHPIVLMYHRVETLPVDPWRLAVTPDRFEAQIRCLAACRSVVPLAWLAARIVAGDRPRHTAAITFDDGYIDVFEKARPILEDAGCPATVFIATGALGSPEGFWWDVLARLLLETRSLPDRLEFSVKGTRHEIGIADGHAGRAAALGAVHALLRPTEPEVRATALAEIAASTGSDAEARPRDLAMAPEQVAEIAASGLIEIGAHTITHPPMTVLGSAAQLREATGSRRRCEELVGRRVETFSYPYGDFDASASAAVREAGLRSACTTVGTAVTRAADPFAIPRVLAADWDEPEFRRSVLRHG